MNSTLDITRWAQTAKLSKKPWLLLGKGPSFTKLSSVPISDFQICTLNHVIREVPADIAHMIDIDVVLSCANELEQNASVLMMPYHPHENHKPSAKTLAQYAEEIPVLSRLAQAGRLIGYNLSTTDRRHGDSPVVQVKFFSAEAALNVLVEIGARKVRSLGIDGGNQYSNAFRDLDESTRLANGHASFDHQFRSIAKTLMKTGLDYAPWYIDAPARIFVGTDHAQIAGLKVLEYSIKKHASISVSVEAIDDNAIPIPQKPENRSKTGFSFSRFRIPELCNYQGRGIYLDADMLVFTDIAKLWTADFDGHHVLYSTQNAKGQRIPQYSVMVLDCNSLNWDVKEIIAGLDREQYNYAELMQQLCIVDPHKLGDSLPDTWNSLEHFKVDKTCLLHYTDMPTQPWVSHDNQNGHLWYAAAREAIDEGFLSREFIYEEVAKGHVSPDLPTWLGLPAPAKHAELVKGWTPPFRRFSANAVPSAPGSVAWQGAHPNALNNLRSQLARQSPKILRHAYRKVRGIVRGY